MGSQCSGQDGSSSGSGSGGGVLCTVIRENLDVRLSASSRGGGGCSSFLPSFLSSARTCSWFAIG